MFLDLTVYVLPRIVKYPSVPAGYESSVIVAEVGPQTTVQVNAAELTLDLGLIAAKLSTGNAAALPAFI